MIIRYDGVTIGYFETDMNIVPLCTSAFVEGRLGEAIYRTSCARREGCLLGIPNL